MLAILIQTTLYQVIIYVQPVAKVSLVKCNRTYTQDYALFKPFGQQQSPRLARMKKLKKILGGFEKSKTNFEVIKSVECTRKVLFDSNSFLCDMVVNLMGLWTFGAIGVLSLVKHCFQPVFLAMTFFLVWLSTGILKTAPVEP